MDTGMRKYWGVAGLLLLSSLLQAQAPFVSQISSRSARPGEQLTVQGINFGTNAANIKVVFGGVAVTPETPISDQFMKVTVPPAAAFGHLQVLNTSTGLSGLSPDKFMVSFGGDQPFSLAATDVQQDFDSENGLYDLAVADLDGDGKLDVVTANQDVNTISVFRNTSSSAVISFAKTTLTPGFKTIHVTTGDLNGDSKPEIIVSELNAARVAIFRNTSMVGVPSFVSSTIALVGSKAKQLKTADLDLDGRQELIVTDQVANRFFVFVNKGSGSAITLAAPLELKPGQTTTGTDALAVADLDGDRFPEIVVGSFQSVSDDLFVVKNKCTPGIIDATTLNQVSVVSVPSAVSNINIADFDSDGKPDLAVTLLLSQGIAVLRNQSTASAISFADGTFFEANQQPWGLDAGDVDGDGKADIAVASITEKKVAILNNTSTPGNFSFTKSTKATNFFNRHISLSDLNNDGRPDIVFTSITNGASVASDLSVVKNNNCVVPKISPDGPLTICSSFNQELVATASEGAQYEWFRNGVSVGAPAASNSFSVSQDGPYTIRMTTDGGACSKTSSPITVTVISQPPLGNATPQPVAPMCIGGTLTLAVNNVGADQYRWSGPQGFSATGLSVPRSNFEAAFAGEYTLEVIVNNCVAQRETIVVDAIAIPEVEVVFPGLDIICTGETKNLSFYPFPNGYDFQWMEQTGGAISGATSSSYVANASGKYFLRLTSTINGTCPPISTPFKKVRVVNDAVADFTFENPGCAGVAMTFTNASITDSDPEDPTVNYSWKFSDQSNPIVGVLNPVRTFATAQTVNVTLTVSYREEVCSGEKEATVTIVQPPSAIIGSSTGSFSFCPEGELTLNLLNGFDSYAWSTGSTSPEITITQPGTYTVTLTSDQCTLTASQVVTQFATPQVEATATPPTINVGEMVTLSATGLSTYRWKPNEGVTDSLTATATVFPLLSTEFSVSGIDTNGCFGSDTLEVTVIPEDNILSLLSPKNYFSPNGDAVNDQWVVNGINAFQCTVTIYNERGLKVYEAEPYDNGWNGVSSNGLELPEGIYFYVIRCQESGDKTMTGTVNIVR
jgi:gliding motility-associated-like protein